MLLSVGTHVPLQSQSVVNLSGDSTYVLLTFVDTLLNKSLVHSSEDFIFSLSLHSSDVFDKHSVDHRYSQLSVMNSDPSLFTLPTTQVVVVHVQYLPELHSVRSQWLVRCYTYLIY